MYESIRVVTPDMEEVKRRFLVDYYPLKAGGGIVFNLTGELLVIFRRGRWDLPKGKVDPGESITQCAIREVEEETGVKAIISNETPIITHHLYTRKNARLIKHTYWYRMHAQRCDVLLAQASEDIETVHWADPEFIRKIIKPNTYPLIRELISGFYPAMDAGKW